MKQLTLGIAVLVGLLVANVQLAQAQNNSLYQKVAATSPLTLENSSMLYQSFEPFRTIQKNSAVQIIVSESDEMRSNANLQRRKTMSLEAVLNNWVKIQNGSLKPAAQAEGAPTVSGTYNGNVRETNDLQTQDTLKFRIGARVTDVMPNGFLVLEGHKEVRDNDEIWDYSITAIADPTNILPNGSILSERLLESKIDKHNRGQMRDGYRRGWVYKAIDRFGAF